MYEEYYLINQEYIRQPEIQNFMNNVEGTVDMTDIKDYKDLKNRLQKFLKQTPSKKQVDVFALEYQVKPPQAYDLTQKEKHKEDAKRKSPARLKKGVPLKTIDERKGLPIRKKKAIRDRKKDMVFLEDVYYQRVKIKGKWKDKEVVHQMNIPKRMEKAGYKYMIRDVKTGRIIKWKKE